MMDQLLFYTHTARDSFK